MQKQFTWTGKPAFRQGLLFGILLGLFSIVLNVMLSLAGLSTLFIGAIETTFTGSGLLISIVGLIVAILAYLLAGMRASQQTGRVGGRSPCWPVDRAHQRCDHVGVRARLLCNITGNW